MGYMEYKKGKKALNWGDSSQDAVDDYLDTNRILKNQAKKLYKSALKNKKLREKVDKIFKRDWNRKATNEEYEFHICFGLGIFGDIYGEYLKPVGCRKFDKYH